MENNTKHDNKPERNKDGEKRLQNNVILSFTAKQKLIKFSFMLQKLSLLETSSSGHRSS